MYLPVIVQPKQIGLPVVRLVNLLLRDSVPFSYDVVIVALLIVLAVPDDRGGHEAP